jgi:hypothetical protein
VTLIATQVVIKDCLLSGHSEGYLIGAADDFRACLPSQARTSPQRNMRHYECSQRIVSYQFHNITPL